MNQFPLDTELRVFEKIWPGGYIETFEGYVNCGCGKYLEKEIEAIGLRPFYSSRLHALELGCGGGFWTRRYLEPNFWKVTCLDVIPKQFSANVIYIEVPEKDFTCLGVMDNSIDFVFSFGLFCHLSTEAQDAYLKSLFRKMKPGAEAVIMFANFKRHPHFSGLSEFELRPYKETNPFPEDGTWFYSDLEMQNASVNKAGFTEFTDMIPDFRDTLAYFRKPL